jgi:probable rRNA maturation factor
VIKVEIANEQSAHIFDSDLLQKAVRIVLDGELIEQGDVSVAIVDDATMHLLNLKYLQHDYATDVLSFLLSTTDEPLEGEIIVSADTAAREAVRYGWDKVDELLLYLIHGTLHLVGHEDASDADRQAMRAKERQYLAELGRHPSYEERLPAIRDAPTADSPGGGETQL